MSWLSDMFGGSNPAQGAMNYIGQIPGATRGYQDPFFQAGKNALNPLQGQYSQLTSDPGGRLNQIGGSYHESPGYKFALQQALEAGQHASNAGGMAGTPQDQFQQMQMATGLANQDYNNYLQNALGLYGAGLSGQQGLAGMGQQAGQSMADMISQALAAQAGYSYAGKAAQNQQRNAMLGNIGNTIGAGMAFMPFMA